MARRRRFSFILISLSVCFGCNKPSATVPATNAAPAPMFHLEHAQAKLPTLKIWLGEAELVTEIARSPIQISTGMMFREKMAENEAMLFVFPGPDYRSFYMKNTKVPLSCAYIDPQGTILEIYDMKPLDETPIRSKSDKIQYVLETPQGWFGRHKVEVGMTVRTESGTLDDTFFPKRGNRP